MMVKKFFEKFNYWTTSIFSQAAVFDHDLFSIALSNGKWMHLKPGEFVKDDYAYSISPARFFVRLESGPIYMINIYDDDFVELLDNLSPEEAREILYELLLEPYVFEGIKYVELESLNMEALEKIKAETLEILKQYGISNEFLRRLENYTPLVPLYLKSVNNMISYVLAGVNNGSIDTYVGIQNSGVFVTRKVKNTMKCLTKLLILNSFPNPHSALERKSCPEISLAAILLAATFNSPVGLTLQTGHSTSRDQLSIAYNLVFPDDPLKVFSAYQTLFNLPKAIDDLLPDSLIEKLERRESLTAEEEYAVARFLDIASALARTGQNRPSLEWYTDRYSVRFVYELVEPVVLEGTFSQLPAKLREEVMKTEQMPSKRYPDFTFSNKLEFLVKVHNFRVYVFYKTRTIKWVVLSDPSKLRECKRIIKERHYAY